MQASTFSRVLEQGNVSVPCISALDRNGNCAVGKTTVHLVPATGGFYGCRCSPETSGDLIFTDRTRQRVGRKLFLSPAISGTRFHSTKASELRSLLGSRGRQTPGAGWRSPSNFWKEEFETERPVSLEKCLEALKKLTFHAQIPVQPLPQQGENGNKRRNGLILTAIAVGLMVLAAPGPILRDSSLTLSNSARADQLGELRQAATLVEKAAEGLTKIRFNGDIGLQVLDKAVTVVTGSTFVDPELLDKEVDGLLSGEKDIQEEFRNGIIHAVDNSWSTIYDLVANFNPGALSESAGASISTFAETGAERVAAFELSALVSLGERWLILTPLIVLPMAWEMKRLKAKSERELREGQAKFVELSGEAQLRGEKVRRELERIELRSSILDAVSSLRKTALLPPISREEAGLIRRRIKDMLERLGDLKPVEDPLLLVPEFASALASGASPNDSLAYVPMSPTIDGDWSLIYVSETTEVSSPPKPPQFLGFGLDNLRQKVWQAANISSLTDDNDIPSPSPLLACDTAEIRLGPLGVLQVAVQGRWENLKDGHRAFVSFDTISARPVEILGNKVSEDIPAINLSLPPALQLSAEWGIAYVDDHLRINRDGQGQLYLFRKM